MGKKGNACGHFEHSSRQYNNYLCQPKRQQMIKKAFIGLLAILTVCSCNEKKESGAKAPTRVKTEVVGINAITPQQQYVGIVEENEATAVSFTSMGVVRRVLVNEGQYVHRGQLLAEMDATTMNNSVEVARASTSQARDMVAQAQSAYDQAKDAYDRMKLLHDNGSLPEIKWIEVETRLQQAETALRTAQAGVRSASAAEKIAQKGLADTRLIAPVSGIIGHKQVVAGETALPSQSVVTILDISSVKVKISVPEQEMSRITAQTPSHIVVDAANRQVNGGRIEKGVQADAMTHTYDIRIHVANPERKLLPGMVASVTLGDGDYNRNAITVPVTSVQKKSDGTLFVWTVSADNTAHRTPVSIGHPAGNRVAITQGLGHNQRIVVEGYQKLSEGTKVIF